MAGLHQALGLLVLHCAGTSAARAYRPLGRGGLAVEVETPEVRHEEMDHYGGYLTIFAHEGAQVVMPACALLLGAGLVLSGRSSVGFITVYLGAQTGFSLYMKIMLSKMAVNDAGLRGVPAAFLITALQQLVTFVVLLLAFAVLSCTRWQYRVKRLATMREGLIVLCFSLSFAANVGLNNLSLSFLSVSSNLTIRSCLPLVTTFVQAILACCQQSGGRSERQATTFPEHLLMLAGVACAGAATVAKSKALQSSVASEHLAFGASVCVLSLVAASLNLVFAATLGERMELNPLDSTWYMAIPAALLLLPVGVFWPHPVDWPGSSKYTDLQVLVTVLHQRPQALVFIALSGLFAAGYNVLQYSMVQRFSPAHTAFAGNFNKAATIMLSIALGLERLPAQPWSAVMILAIMGNILAFASYSALTRAKRGRGAGAGAEEEVAAGLKAEGDASGGRALGFDGAPRKGGGPGGAVAAEPRRKGGSLDCAAI